MSIQNAFNKYASQYDESRKQLIPCFNEFYAIAIETIPFKNDREIEVLDLGAGTGLMTEMVASSYPKARIKLVDIAGNMLSEAKKRLGSYPNKFDFTVVNYAQKDALNQNYDLIISSLSIHHLTAKEKRRLYRNIREHLNPGGVFINADQVLGETEEIDEIYQNKWIEQVKGKGVSNEELQAALERMKEDKMSTLSSQLQWLKEAGFTNINCWFKHYNFVVYSGRRT